MTQTSVVAVVVVVVEPEGDVPSGSTPFTGSLFT
jgi:hypothetical protein